jgi:hypothetical protein
MSALGHKRTFREIQTMSALPPKADIANAIARGSVKSQGTNRSPQPRSSLLARSCPDVVNLPGAIQGFDTEMDRADAIRLLQALAAAGMDTRAPKANVWIEKKALEIGLEGGQFASALAYAGNEGWLADAPRKGWTSLTRAGAAIARR